MGVPRAAGHPDFSYGSTSELVPILWAGEARQKLNAQLVLNEISNPNVIGANR